MYLQPALSDALDEVGAEKADAVDARSKQACFANMAANDEFPKESKTG